MINKSTPIRLACLTAIATAFVLVSGQYAQVNAQARDPFAKLAATSRMRLLAAVGDLQAMANGPTMQAACIECSTMGSPRHAPATNILTTLATLAK